jgi:L-amino acid N-acyltransferase
MSVRLVEDRDLEALVEIYNDAILTLRCTADMDIFTVEERLSWLREHQCLQYPMYVYEAGNKVAGYIYFSAYRPGRRALKGTAEISYYIHKDYQRKGIGTELLEFSIKKAKELQFHNLVAILLGCNTPSIKLLEKFGFKKWGCLPGIVDLSVEVCDHLYYGLKLRS